MQAASMKGVGLAAWTAVLLSFPLVSLFGESESGFEFIPITAIAAAFLFSLARLPLHKIISVVAMGGVGALLFALFFILLAEPHDPGKLTNFLLVIVAFGLMLGVALQEPLFRGRVPAALLLIGGFALILFILDPSAYQTRRFSYGDSNPIWMARTMGLAGISAIWFIARGQKWAWGLLLAICAAIALTGSRGPLLSLAAALGFGLIFLRNEGRVSTLIVASYAASVVLAFQIGFGIVPQLRAFDFNTDSGRGLIYSYAVEMLDRYPSGLGVGNFRLGPAIYPHNLFLEFLVEWGWILGGAWIVLICWGGVRLLRLPASFDVLKLAFVVELLNSQFSGDITTPRMLYALVLVGLMTGRRAEYCPAASGRRPIVTSPSS